MSINLIESKRTSRKAVRGVLLSIAVHACVITIAVIATAHAGEVAERPIEIFTPISSPEAPQHTPLRTHSAHGPTGDASVPRIPALPPVGVPAIPNVPDVPLPARNCFADCDAMPWKSARGDSAPSGRQGDGTSGDPYSASQVEKAALVRSGNPSPRYPSLLESTRVDGSVLVQFVVDTAGRADMRTFTVLASTSELFSESVRVALAQWRFDPAEAGGHRVAQIVQLPLKFVAPNH